MGTLYLVATPIGNLEDVSARSLRILREVQLTAAEDTRVTRRLLSHYKIDTRLISYFEHNKIKRMDLVLQTLEAGDVALVSDAGTPGLNDPGYELVRAAIERGHRVSAIPGPSSPVAALVASGLPTDSFLYLGFVPRKAADRRASFKKVAELPYTLVFLESPHRLTDTLTDMGDVLGDRHVAIARELTKLHEEIWRGRLSAASRHFVQARGEFVLVVSGKTSEEKAQWAESKVRAAVRKQLMAGTPPTIVAAQLAHETGWSRRAIYRLATSLR